MILWDETMQHSVLTEKLNSLAEGSGLDVLGFADASEFKGYRLSHSPQKKAADWEKTCFLSDLSKISEGEFRRRFDRLNTGYAFDIFQRNVLLALENARQLK